MKILCENGIGDNKKLRFNLVESSGPSLADYIGQRLKIKAYVLFENPPKENETEPTKVIKMLLDDNQIAGTTSKSFINGFERYLQCMETEEVDELEVSQAKSKAGRPYLTFKT